MSDPSHAVQLLAFDHQVDMSAAQSIACPCGAPLQYWYDKTDALYYVGHLADTGLVIERCGPVFVHEDLGVALRDYVSGLTQYARDGYWPAVREHKERWKALTSGQGVFQSVPVATTVVSSFSPPE